MTDATAPAPQFAELGLAPALVEVVTSLGYESPTPIQAQAIPALLAGADVVGLAQTGTGKTAAFALPIIDRLDDTSNQTQALVLAPTRELALQVCEAFSAYAAAKPGIRVLPIYGGQNYGFQLSGLKKGAQVVVGTPGRVIDHLERGSLDLSHLDVMVLDEADEMLNMGFAEDVERVLAETPEYKQVALFSATMPAQIRQLAKKYLHEPQDISTPQAKQSTSSVRQRWIGVSHHHKLDALSRVLEVESGDAMIVFVRTKQATEELAEKLRARGYAAAALNGDLAQAQRERTVGQLKSGAIDIIVATDVAARGLDVSRISHVVNYDIPHDTEAYVHRIGRTGRAGRTGEAIVFVTPRERRMLSAIEKVSGQPVIEMSIPSAEEVNARRVDRFGQSISTSMAAPQFAAFRGLVEEYARENAVDMTDVAAALAVMSSDDKEFFLRPDPPVEARSKSARGPKPPRVSDGSFTTYRLAVGKRHKVRPSMVVGALANEGGLRRSDFGKITVGVEHTLVELPNELPDAVFDALASTRISGKLIDIELDTGPKRAPRNSGGAPRKAGGASGRKPAGSTHGKSAAAGNKRKPRAKKRPTT